MTIYGLRLKGDKEVRYIGQTNSTFLEARLAGHMLNARLRKHNNDLCDWLSANADSIDIFKIGYADTREEALALERAIMALCQRLDHRLLNLVAGRKRNTPTPAITGGGPTSALCGRT